MKLFLSQRPYIALGLLKYESGRPAAYLLNPEHYSTGWNPSHSILRDGPPAPWVTSRPHSVSDASTPDCAQSSLSMSSKITIVASGVVCAMLIIASVITRASSCFWACVLPVHISTRTIGIPSPPWIRLPGAGGFLHSR